MITTTKQQEVGTEPPPHPLCLDKHRSL